jgi:hypothetical protein
MTLKGFNTPPRDKSESYLNIIINIMVVINAACSNIIRKAQQLQDIKQTASFYLSSA